MPIATLADLYTSYGISRVDALLDINGDGNVTDRLNQALEEGDRILAQRLELPTPETCPPVLRTFAVDEAFYWLQYTSQSGASAADIERAVMRRQDLNKMRERKLWPGRAEPEQRTGRTAVISNPSPYSLKGWYR